MRLGAGVERVEPGVRVHLSDGATLEAERLLVATGRRPNVEGLGLEELGVEITQRGVEVDERLRAADDVWAIGDVNRHRAVHARRQVPGARRGGRHRRPRARRLPRDPGGHLHRSRRWRRSGGWTATAS